MSHLPFRSIIALSAIVMATSSSIACSGDDDDTSGTPTDGSTATLNDNQIAAVMSAANTGEIQEGQVAQSKATNSDVKAFADGMVTEHTAARTRGDALFATLGITPHDNATSIKLTTEATAMVASLQAMSGAAFDRAYMDGQVSGHQEVLDLIDTMLMPTVTRPELRAELVTMRATVSTHLDHAKMIQTMLSTGTDGGSDAGTETGVEAGSDTGSSSGDASTIDASSSDAALD